MADKDYPPHGTLDPAADSKYPENLLSSKGASTTHNSSSLGADIKSGLSSFDDSADGRTSLGSSGIGTTGWENDLTARPSGSSGLGHGTTGTSSLGGTGLDSGYGTGNTGRSSLGGSGLNSGTTGQSTLGGSNLSGSGTGRSSLGGSGNPFSSGTTGTAGYGSGYDQHPGSLSEGPVADKARREMNQTQNEFSNLANSRHTPHTPAATGQNLTHYHSFFYNLLNWSNPRATGITYVAIASFILAWRFLPLTRYALRGTWMVLGLTAAAEVAGRLVLDQGLTSKLRPRKYYTIPRETLETTMDDLTELINFFVIEFQRVLYAENVYVTIATCLTALLTYFLVKVTPAWGLALMFTTCLFFAPLIYLSNKQLIDTQLANGREIVRKQTRQVRDLASHHTSRAMAVSSNTMKDYSAKAQGALGQKTGSTGLAGSNTATAGKTAGLTGTQSTGSLSSAEEQLRGAPSVPSSDLKSALGSQERTAKPVGL
ncbi:hypothetical protein K470DRAFT_253961 [Piedraia hortae CBS 480.64]|uniref:Reticulon-like protein n=1 Tax=Piedraia hortae CBS 480.64 TaxID=1314780 RepID=A0A6A7C9U6_9PEZI|nr:hypothetical protein K470DRAFT_253961 [Piedraia hortae CBS 480.64]